MLPFSHSSQWPSRERDLILPSLAAWKTHLDGNLPLSLSPDWQDKYPQHFLGHHKNPSSVPVSFQQALAPSHRTALSFTPLVPTQPVIIMTNIIYANVIRLRNMIVERRAPLEIYHSEHSGSKHSIKILNFTGFNLNVINYAVEGELVVQQADIWLSVSHPGVVTDFTTSL